MRIEACKLHKGDLFEFDGLELVAVSDWTLFGVLVADKKNFNELGVYTYDQVRNLEIEANVEVKIQ